LEYEEGYGYFLVSNSSGEAVTEMRGEIGQKRKHLQEAYLNHTKKLGKKVNTCKRDLNHTASD
jgi:hypothetical protein